MVWLQVLNVVLSLVILGLLLALGWSLRGVFLTYLERLTILFGTRDQIRELADKFDQVRISQAEEIGVLSARLDHLPELVTVRPHQEAELLSELWDALLSFQEAALDLQSVFEETGPQGPVEGLAQRRIYEKTYRDLSTVLHRRRPFYPAAIFQALLRIMTLGDPQTLSDPVDSQATEESGDPSTSSPNASERIPDVVDEIDQVGELIRTHLMG